MTHIISSPREKYKCSNHTNKILTPFDYQEQAMKLGCEHYVDNQIGLNSSVQGSGKTTMALYTAINMYRMGMIDRTIIAVPTRAIIDSYVNMSGTQIITDDQNILTIPKIYVETDNKINTFINHIKSDMPGFFIVTHSLMANVKVRNVIKEINNLKKTLFICDEAQHCYMQMMLDNNNSMGIIK